jgi:hypothetical protein
MSDNIALSIVYRITSACFFDCMICKFNFHQPPDGVNDSNVEPMRRPKPMTDLSIMMNRNRTQNRTPENNMNQDNRTPSIGIVHTIWWLMKIKFTNHTVKKHQFNFIILQD